MKKSSILLSVIVSLLAASAARAQVTIHITGATAFRANAYRSISNLFATAGSLTGQNPAGNASSQNRVTWQGTLTQFGAQPVTIRASYSGSAAGVQALAQNLNVTFLTSGTPGDTNTISAQADLAFSDVFQTTTLYTSPVLSDLSVGVTPFAYVKGVNGVPSSVTNITIQQLQSFLGNGYNLLSYFTGNPAHDGNFMYLVGRDAGSGTRASALRDALFVGLHQQYNQVGGVWSLSAGYASGSGIVALLNTNTVEAAIGYLGLPDANNVNGGLNVISYNGMKPYLGSPSAPDWSPITKGLYSFWSYEHLFARTTASANVVNFRTSLANEIDADLQTSTTAIPISAMLVLREDDGGVINP